MKKIQLKTLFGSVTLALLLAQNASAGNYRDYAQVTRVDPIYERVTQRIPETHCRVETHPNRRSDSHTGTIVGGIVGAAIGNELGNKKRNKQVGALAGGLLGASIGRDISRGNTRSAREVCETHYQTRTERQLVGYRVDYRYQGRNYQTRTDQHPGRRIPVSVNVRPAL
ncbi:glycine zipper 2TM domain-containing protein [Marinimicrobium sp. ABcell2]|uniref:glycine zipper 2TM domain-containing protein n=1 Tax=Marinimicrobium sp. ABcell2 TaxID=3069751 RepID=UPI0027ADD830|nr:glycine zipper 2TM domain-containing protein [Marinimicrobium sp. ABcell2]MDQ2076286.1 glycine zipper 2TM domain-containing protein [Marinimicrobium sp. ABcell2]